MLTQNAVSHTHHIPRSKYMSFLRLAVTLILARYSVLNLIDGLIFDQCYSEQCLTTYNGKLNKYCINQYNT